MKPDRLSPQRAELKPPPRVATPQQENDPVCEDDWVLVGTSRPQKTTSFKEDGPLLADTWTFAGKSYRASEFCVPQPLHAAFQPPKASAKIFSPWDYDRSKFNIRPEVSRQDDDSHALRKKGIVRMAHADVAAVTARRTDYGNVFCIELSHAQEGKFAATEEEFLRAVHAAKMTTMGISWDG